MRSNLCKICGTLGGGGTENCVNKKQHDLLIRSKQYLRSMKEGSFLFQFSTVQNAGHSALKRVLSKTVNEILDKKNKPSKSLSFKRNKKVCVKA